MSTSKMFELDGSYWDMADPMAKPHLPPGSWNVSEQLAASHAYGPEFSQVQATAETVEAQSDQAGTPVSELPAYDAFPKLRTMPKHWNLSELA